MSTKDEKHYFKVTGETPGEYPHDSIDWGVPNSRLPACLIVEVEGYYPDYTEVIRQKLREYALAKDPTQISESGPFGFSFEEFANLSSTPNPTGEHQMPTNANDNFLKIKTQIENDLAQAIEQIDGDLVEREYAILKLKGVQEKLNDLLNAHEEATAEAFNAGCDSEGVC